MDESTGRATGRLPASSQGSSERLQKQSSQDTAPEVAIRRAAHRRGLRFRVNYPIPLTGTRRRADLAFPGQKIAVYVDGCFWHACPVHGTSPKHNADWWQAKLAANVERDRDTDARLLSVGWIVVRFWEHEDAEEAADRLLLLVQERRPKRRH